MRKFGERCLTSRVFVERSHRNDRAGFLSAARGVAGYFAPLHIVMIIQGDNPPIGAKPICSAQLEGHDRKRT